MKRYLAIDIGKRRHGIAVSDAGNRIALPREPIAAYSDEDVEKLKKTVKKENIGTLIAGLPYGLSGKETSMTKYVRKVAAEIGRKLDIPVQFADERFTSKMTGPLGKIPKGERDSMSAAIILQMELDRRARSAA